MAHWGTLLGEKKGWKRVRTLGWGVAFSEADYSARAHTNKHVYKRARCAFSLPRTAAPCSLCMRRSARVSKPAERFDEMPFGVKLLSLVALAALSAPTVQPAAAAAAASAPSAKRARLVRAALLAARVPLSHALQRPAPLRRRPHPRTRPPRPRPPHPRLLPRP